MALTSTTELEAVNAMLDAIGESPVNTLQNSGVVDAANARRLLTMTSRAVQAKGWHWNTDKGRVLTCNPAGEVALPANTLKVDTVGADEGLDAVRRGQRLYDRRRQTFVIGRSVTVDLVTGLDFDDLPETARQYIMTTAARKFQENAVGSEILDKFTKRDELLALAALLEEEGENADHNMIRDNPTMQEMLFR